MKSNSFCIFIISHGRPDKVVTLQTLKKCGYTGPLFIVCDNEDKTVDKYIENFGKDRIVIFDKIAYAKKIDNCDNFNNRRSTTHARNACFDIAANKGFSHFLVLDDDYTRFHFTFDRTEKWIRRNITNFNRICEIVIEFLNCDDRIKTVCMMQGGDMIGGEECTVFKGKHFPFKRRKAMNSFFCKTSQRFWFFSRLNEDVNTYLLRGSTGDLFFTLSELNLQQAQTQSTAGGMSEAYLASGTYVKSFYSVMICPSCVITTVPGAMQRLHHKINWSKAVPKILDDSFKKYE